MAVQLDSLIDTHHIEIDGECKKLKSWTFASASYCVAGNCDTEELILVFEDESKKRIKDLSQLSNCE